MPIYTVASSTSATTPRKNDKDAAVVIANGTAEAKSVAGTYFDGDSQAVWGAATVTSLAATPATVLPLTGWVFNITVGAAGANANVTVTGDSDDTLDDIAAKLVTALNATAINGAAYNSTTNVLKIAETTDALGDKAVVVTVTPPDGLYDDEFAWVPADLVGAIVDEGSGSAVLSVTFSTTWVAPGLVFAYKQ